MNDIKEQLRIFNEERDWDQFHSPENLAKSVAIEAVSYTHLWGSESTSFP